MLSLPLRSVHGSHSHTDTLTILRKFEFESSLMRSGVLAVEGRPSQGRAPGDALLIVRGAAASIEQLVGRHRLPPDYRKVNSKPYMVFCKMSFIFSQRLSTAVGQRFGKT